MGKATAFSGNSVHAMTATTPPALCDQLQHRTASHIVPITRKNDKKFVCPTVRLILAKKAIRAHSPRNFKKVSCVDSMKAGAANMAPATPVLMA